MAGSFDRGFPIGSPRLSGPASLNDAPLTVEDWRVVHQGYMAFMSLVRRVAADAWAREDKARAARPEEA